ncbi:MAG: hypothetical protein JNK82_35910 [Myxococcaceae bacterium]|nr:hypothetical protein [Myxococcaceae bacterium]
MNLTSRASLFAAVVVSSTPLAAEPVTAKFTVTDGDSYQVTVQQGGRRLPCPELVTVDRPCELQLERGPATVVADGSPSFDFDYEHTASTSHALHFRRTWPKWVGAVLVSASIASFALWGIKQSRCGGRSPSDRVDCDSAYVGVMFGVPLLALGLPAFIWGLFTGNRTLSRAL